jgi:hypothetical protein
MTPKGADQVSHDFEKGQLEKIMFPLADAW